MGTVSNNVLKFTRNDGVEGTGFACKLNGAKIYSVAWSDNEVGRYDADYVERVGIKVEGEKLEAVAATAKKKD